MSSRISRSAAATIFLVALFSSLWAERYTDINYDVWLSGQTNIFPNLARPRTMLVWETYQFQSLAYQLRTGQGWSYKNVLALDDKNDVPGRVVNYYSGHYLKDAVGRGDYFFKGDEVWFYYYPRAFPGVLLVFRDEAADGLIIKGEDRDNTIDGIGVIDKNGSYVELRYDYFPESKNYEFTLPDGRLARANLNWYRQVFREVIRANVNNLARWYDFNELLPGGKERDWAQDVGENPKTGLDDKRINLR